MAIGSLTPIAQQFIQRNLIMYTLPKFDCEKPTSSKEKYLGYTIYEYAM